VPARLEARNLSLLAERGVDHFCAHVEGGEAHSTNALPCKVKQVNYLGADLNVAVEAAGRTITVIQRREKTSFEMGQHVFLSCDTDAAHLLP